MTSNLFRNCLVGLCGLLFVGRPSLEAQVQACPQAFTEKQKQALTQYCSEEVQAC